MMKYVETSSTGTHSVGYTYDSLNNLTALTETFGDTVRKFSYAYDGDNRPTSITAGNSTLNYGYDNFGRVETLTTKHDGNAFATKNYSYKLDANGKPTNQVSSVTVEIGSNRTTYTYTYDQNGNITGIDTTTKVGDQETTLTTSYAYDSANQLIREDNQEAGTTTVWTYDDAGNILKREVYPYADGTLDPADRTAVVDYTYEDEKGWGDLLTEYNGNTITHDNIGNPLNDGTWSYTWQHGRQLASMTKLDGSAQWNYTYNADGMRTKRTNGTTTYQYTYRGGQLTHMTVDGHTMYFTYDASGTPLNMVYDGLKFYYITNLQGDVIAIVNGNGQEFVRYTYDAWGNVTATGSATNLRYYNPLRYRGYVYDEETELYYLQSRYYDSEMGRFINADVLVSREAVLGNNMFAYCGNDPISNTDVTGLLHERIATGGGVADSSKKSDRITLIFTSGYYVCFSVGAFNISATIEPSFDLKGNTQLFSTCSFDVTTSGSLSISGGGTASVLFAPDTTYCKGDAIYLGGGIACPIPDTPISGTASANVLRTSDGYWGIATTTGVAWPADTKVGGDFHGGYSYTHAWLPQVNLFDLIRRFLK